MNLIDYIKNNRRGKDSNRLEREALADPFLTEALEGLDSVQGDHAEYILQLQKHVRYHRKRYKGISRIWKATAAAILLLFGFGAYVLVDSYQSNLLAKETKDPKIIDIFVPEGAYIKHKTSIKLKNIAAQEAFELQLISPQTKHEVSEEMFSEEE